MCVCVRENEREKERVRGRGREIPNANLKFFFLKLNLLPIVQAASEDAKKTFRQQRTGGVTKVGKGGNVGEVCYEGVGVGEFFGANKEN